jgi:SprT-like family
MIYEHVKLRGHELVTPTPRMLRHWWARLNDEVFGGELLPPAMSLEALHSDAYGSCHDRGARRVLINLEPRHEWTRSLMLDTLAHEMVHQKQHQDGGQWNHGETFERWREPILTATGLTI